MKDVQSEKDKRGIAIKKVGVSKVEMPFNLKDKEESVQMTLGVWDAFVYLKTDARGTHMSRFIEVLQHHKRDLITLDVMENNMKRTLKAELGAVKAHVEVEFPYFIKKYTPETAKECLLKVEVKFTVSDYHKPMMEVTTPVTTLCPCSKEISKWGAHNQRSFVTIQCMSNEWIWIEDLVLIAEGAASCPIWPLLKRPDEKWVTELAYMKPRFVEDVVREVALKMRTLDISWYKVIVVNEESVHTHNAYAELEEKVSLKPWQKAAKDEHQKKVDQ